VHFSKHYTLEEARLMLPMVRQWLTELEILQKQLGLLDERLAVLLAKGDDVGGEPVHRLIKMLVQRQQTLGEFRQRQIQVKDLRRGLVDFPSVRQGREVFLCWEKDEEDIEFWHELETGYAGRERL